MGRPECVCAFQCTCVEATGTRNKGGALETQPPLMSPFQAAYLLSFGPSPVPSLAGAMPDVCHCMNVCLPGLRVDVEIIHMMAEHVETTVQGRGGAYEIRATANPPQTRPGTE